jgi:hypothetical protein
MKIDRQSGELATGQQSDAIFELFLTEHVPSPSARPPVSDEENDDLKAVDIF